MVSAEQEITVKARQPTAYQGQGPQPLGSEITVLAGPAGTVQAKRPMWELLGKGSKKSPGTGDVENTQGSV